MEFIREGGSKNLVGQSGVDVYIKATDRAQYKVGKKGQRDNDVDVHSSQDIVTITGIGDGDRIWISAVGGRAAWSYDAADLTGPLDDPDDITIEEIKRSLSAGSTSSFKPQETVTGFGNSITAYVNSFVHWMVRTSGNRYVYKANYGVPGDTTQDMLDRIDAIPDDTQIITVMEGTNDAGQGVTPLQHATNMRQILTTLKSRGFSPVLILCPPRDEYQDLLYEYNVYDFFTAKELEIPCFASFDQFTDVVDGSWSAGSSGDGVHPTTTTEKTAGETMYDSIRDYNYSKLLTRDDTRGILDNNCFLQTFDNRPSFWAIVNTGARSVTTQPAFAMGDTYDFKCTGGLGYIYRPNLSVTQGNTYVINGVLQGTINSGNVRFSFYGSYGSGGSRHYLLQDCTVNLDRQEFYLEFDATQTSADFRIYVTVEDADDQPYDADMKMAQIQMYDKTAYTLV